MITMRAVVCGSYQSNAYLVWQEERNDLIIVDPGDSLDALENEIRLSGKTPAAILLTHGHFDHTIAAAALKEKYGARIYIHPADAPMLEDAGAAMLDEKGLSLPFTPTCADEELPADGAFEVCGITWTCLNTPGHTPGGVCLTCAELGAIFTGDTIFKHGFGRFDLAGGDRRALMKSIMSLLQLDEELTAWPGHGEPDRLGDIAERWPVRRMP